MKKFLAWLLLTAAILGLCGCATVPPPVGGHRNIGRNCCFGKSHCRNPGSHIGNRDSCFGRLPVFESVIHYLLFGGRE